MRHRGIAAILLGVVFATPAAGANYRDLPVPLIIEEPAGLDRVDEPVTTGVPFAPGVLKKDAPLALLDTEKQEVPLQTRVLARWPDGSAKWVLLDFQTSVKAKGSTRLSLVRQKPKAVPRHPIAVKVSKGDLTVYRLTLAGDRSYTARKPLEVTTGAATVHLNRQAFDLFAGVLVEKGDWIVPTGLGGLVVTDRAGRTRTSVRDIATGYAVKVVEKGPLRTVVRADGEMQATAKDRIGFTCWYHFCAGKRYVRVFFTVRNLKGKAFTATDQHSVRDLAYQKMVAKHAGNVSLEAVDLVLHRARPAIGERFTFGGDRLITGTIRGESVTLYQDSSAGWTWQAGDGRIVDPRLKANKEWMAKNGPEDKRDLPYWEYTPSCFKALTDQERYVGCTFRGYRVRDDKATVLGSGDRAPGWVQIGGVIVGVGRFWQMYPKSITVSNDGSIGVGLWPTEWAQPHVFEGSIHKTHELLFRFGDEPGAAAADASFRRFDRRLVARTEDPYQCATGAFNGRLMPEDRGDFKRFEDWALTAVTCGVNPNVNLSLDSSLEIEREKYDQFGVWHFGATSKRGWRGFGQYLELDIPYCLVAHYARTGNRAFFDEAEIHVRQLMDVPAHGGGYGHQKGESSHYYTTGALLYYYLTGLEFIKESIKVSHDEHAKPAPWHARSFAITMWSNLDLYRAFGEQQYLDKCRADLAWFARAQDPVTGFRPYGQTNFQEFMLGMMMDALGRYCIEFPEEQEWRDRLVALSNATMRTHPKWKQNNSCCNGHTYAWLFTGRDKHLDFAAGLLDASLRPGDEKWPAFRTGTGSGKYWSEFGHRLTQTHMWARWYRKEHGTPKPPAAITDLAAVRKGDQIELTWTAPASGKGAADRYVVKVASKPIKDYLATKDEGKTAANWWMTPLVAETPPAPAAPGTKQTMRIALKSPGAACVAVRSLKQVGPITAVSDLSNVVEVPAP